MKLLYLDCFSGISGDMMLGALCELTDGIELLREGIAKLGLPSLSIQHHEVLRAGIGATKIDVLIDGRVVVDPGPVHPPASPPLFDNDSQARHHSTGEHHHPASSEGSRAGASRTLREIESIISGSDLTPEVKDRSLDVFQRLVSAEAEVHRVAPAQVHLHEAGALDAIADVVGAALLLERLSPDRVAASAVNVGVGEISCEHGVYPIPGPAAALLMRGAPIYSSGPVGELVTPTGAALLASFVSEFGPLPLMRASRIGAGAGARDTSPRPNILRAFVGDAGMGAGAEGEVVVVECTIDDMNPQNYGYVIEKLLASGALDVFFTPVQMKKNRPGILVTALCEEAVLPAVADVFFTETTTIGFRYRRERRRELERHLEEVETPYGRVHVKISREQGVVRSAQPEYEDCRRLAAEQGVPLKEVQAAAASAWRRLRGEARPISPAAQARGKR